VREKTTCPCCGHAFVPVSATARRHEEIMAAWGTGATAAKIAEQFGLARQSVLREVCEARAAGDPREEIRPDIYPPEDPSRPSDGAAA
jgi:hypothetical protein